MSSSFRQPVDKKARSEQEDPTLKLAVLRDRMSAMLRVTLSDVAERTELAADAGQIKRRLGMPILDMQREKVVIEEAGKYAETLGLSKEEGEELALLVIRIARRRQEEA